MLQLDLRVFVPVLGLHSQLSQSTYDRTASHGPGTRIRRQVRRAVAQDG